MRPIVRTLCAVAIGGALALPATLAIAQSAGRDPYRCLLACRNIKNACDTACTQRCNDLYPNNYELRYECLRTCYQTCKDQENQCDDLCRIDRVPPSPQSP